DIVYLSVAVACLQGRLFSPACRGYIGRADTGPVDLEGCPEIIKVQSLAVRSVAVRCPGIRLCHRRCRLGRMRACQPPERDRQKFGASARSWSKRPQHLDSRPARVRPTVQGESRELDVSDRAGTRTGRPNCVSAARQGARRIELDQWPAVRARPA